jgi:hypothetical protein
VDPRIAEIARLSALRRRAEFDFSIDGMLSSMARQARAALKKGTGAADAWIACVPTELSERSRLEGVRSGTLHVVVDGSSSLWELDRLLRCGLEARIRESTNGAVQRVRLRVGADPVDDVRTPRQRDPNDPGVFDDE